VKNFSFLACSLHRVTFGRKVDEQAIGFTIPRRLSIRDDTLPILPMGSQSVRPVAGTIQSHPVPECTACPGILAEPCKHKWTLCSRADSNWPWQQNKGENGSWDKGPPFSWLHLRGRCSQRGENAEVLLWSLSEPRAHLRHEFGRNFDCYRNETTPRGTPEVIGSCPSFRSIERTARPSIWKFFNARRWR